MDWKWIGENWDRLAPFLYSLGGVVIAIIGSSWALIARLYRHRLESRQDTIENLKSSIELLKNQIAAGIKPDLILGNDAQLKAAESELQGFGSVDKTALRVEEKATVDKIATGEQLGSVKQQVAKYWASYSETWKTVHQYYFWQVAWLWLGKEPDPNFRDDYAAWAAYKMLCSEAFKGNLAFSQGDPGRADSKKAGPLSIVTRKDLIAFAQSRFREIPEFLRD